MSAYIPTTQKVEDRYWLAIVNDEGVRLRANEERCRAEFRAWLAEHDAKVRAEALREARDNVRATYFWADGSDNYAGRVRGYLNFEADHIEKEAGL